MKMKSIRDSLIFDPPELGCVLDLPGLPGGGSKTYDRSLYGSVGTITGATWARTEGGLWCLSFDGADNLVTIPGRDFSAPNGTVEFWMRPDEWIEYPALVSDFDTIARTQYFIILRHGDVSPNEGKLQFSINGGSGENQAFSTTIPTVGRWYHIACTWGARGMEIYVDGGLEGTNAYTGEWAPASGQDLLLGDFYQVAALRLFEGLLLAVRIYNRALTALEIQNHAVRERLLFGVQ